MSERSNYLTVIVSDPTKEEASALIGHPKMSAASWSHAINDRDAKDAEIAELRALAAERSECADQAGEVAAEAIAAQRKAESERDEARECVGRLYKRLSTIVRADDSEALCQAMIEAAREALTATPEHLRGAV